MDPSGTRYIIDTDSCGRIRVKRVLPGQGEADAKPVGPVFTSLVAAGEYRDSLTGGATFRYGPGPV